MALDQWRQKMATGNRKGRRAAASSSNVGGKSASRGACNLALTLVGVRDGCTDENTAQLKFIDSLADDILYFDAGFEADVEAFAPGFTELDQFQVPFASVAINYGGEIGTVMYAAVTPSSKRTTTLDCFICRRF